MRITTTRRIAVGFAVTSVLLTGACGEGAEDTSGGPQVEDCADVDLSTPPAEPVKIRFGSATGGDVYSPIFALDIGPTEAHPNKDKWYTAEYTPFRANEDRFTAYQAGGVDGFLATPPAPWIANARGIDAQIVATTAVHSPDGSNNTAWVAAPDSDIQDLSDLSGAQLGIIDFKSMADLGARAAVGLGGVDPDEANYTVLPIPAQVEGVLSGQIDVGMAVEPIYTAAQPSGIRTIFTIVDVLKAYGEKLGSDVDMTETDLMYAMFGEKFIAENTAAVCAWKADLDVATRWVEDNLETARKLWLEKKFVTAPPAVYLNLPVKFPAAGNPVDVTTMKVMIEIAQDVDIIDETQVPDIDTMIADIADIKGE